MTKTLAIKKEYSPGSYKINPQQLHFVCNLFGQYKSVEQIRKLLKSIHNVTVSPPTLYAIRENNQEKIEELRQKYLAKIDDVPIAQDKVRLERIEHLYQFSTTIRCKKDMIESAIKTLRAAREETKGDGATAPRPGDVSFMQFNFNNMSDKDLLALERRLKKSVINVDAKPEFDPVT